MNRFGAVLLGLWRGLDGVRKFLHLLLLLIIFGFIFGALSVSIPEVPARAALVIAPEGELVDQLSGDPIQRAIEEAQGQGRAETLVWDLVDAIRAAAKDRRIRALVLDLDRFQGAGQPTLVELTKAINEFRETDKPVIAYGLEFLQDPYYVAAHADEIYIDPLGYVVIEGYGRYRWFYKEALDELAVSMNVFRVGEYKSAVEVYTRTDMSPEERQASLAYLNSLWSTYQTTTAGARQLEPDSVVTYANELATAVSLAGGDGAKVALAAGLVTGIKSRPEVEERLIELVGKDEVTGSFNSVSQHEYVRVAHAEKALRGDGKGRIGVIVASGEILDGDQPSGAVGGDSTARLIREARENDDIRALVLRVDSPGGSMFASEQIHREILEVKKAGKPVVVSMGDLAASGGYYISAPADEIIASPATLTGSIGIFAVIPTVDGTLGKVGVHVDGVGTTPLAGQLRLDRPLGDEAKTFIQAMIERGYDVFLERVSSGRNKTREQVDEVAHGRVWSGVDAKRLGLVDSLGSFDDAVKSAAARAELTDYQVEFIEPSLSWAQELALKMKVWGIRTLFRGDERLDKLVRVAAALDPLQQEVERLTRFSVPNRVYAYCFCSVP